MPGAMRCQQQLGWLPVIHRRVLCAAGALLPALCDSTSSASRCLLASSLLLYRSERLGRCDSLGAAADGLDTSCGRGRNNRGGAGLSGMLQRGDVQSKGRAWG